MSADNSPPPPPASPRAFATLPQHTAPPTPSPSPSPPATLCGRLSNGSLTAPSRTNSRGSIQGVSFLLQIGLTRETVTLDPGDHSLPAVRELVCSIVDQKVRKGELMRNSYLKQSALVDWLIDWLIGWLIDRWDIQWLCGHFTLETVSCFRAHWRKRLFTGRSFPGRHCVSALCFLSAVCCVVLCCVVLCCRKTLWLPSGAECRSCLCFMEQRPLTLEEVKLQFITKLSSVLVERLALCRVRFRLGHYVASLIGRQHFETESSPFTPDNLKQESTSTGISIATTTDVTETWTSL